MASYPTRKEYQINTAASWASLNPLLEAGLLCVEVDTGVMKVGDGVSPYNALPDVTQQEDLGDILGTMEEFNLAVSNGTFLFFEDFPTTDPEDGVTIWNDEGTLKVSVMPG